MVFMDNLVCNEAHGKYVIDLDVKYEWFIQIHMTKRVNLNVIIIEIRDWG